ncbi:helix-turn-helix domain-containing protein [Microbulbifer sp. OS29]|uniref:Helix-turn-helix domain-containing protein n=2 Tax=Microbulbifer okhotskensis TaxID=2926617 RepID=A0A9X2ES24_9GAMM|nr:helix-turn-helix domain-containing protein [Microbulbifer okhotskensis]
MSVAQVSRETGVSEPTLYNWCNQFSKLGVAVPADPRTPRIGAEIIRESW